MMIRLLLSILICVGTLSGKGLAQVVRSHPVSVIHPGISETEPVSCLLIEDDRGPETEYTMEIPSVVCGDQVCRVDMLKIVWDKWGKFDRLEIPEGVYLEKAEGAHFTTEDYQKLQRILKDATSPLQDFYKGEMVGTVGSEGVGAMSSASIGVPKSAYVQGAIWTCYTLWHWVQGETRHIIRTLSGNSYSSAGLADLLPSKNPDYQLFAIEQLTQRQDFSPEIVARIFEEVKLSDALLKPSLSYWDSAPDTVFEPYFSRLIAISSPQNRIRCFRFLSQTERQLPPSFFQHLSLDFSIMTFQEVHLFLNLLTIHSAISPELIQKLFPLLEADNFLTARRVYWFLVDQTASLSQRERLKSFASQWGGRL